MIDLRLLALPLLILPGCRDDGGGARRAGDGGSEWANLRDRMVREQIVARGIRDPKTLAAMRAVPRHLFVPEARRANAYDDSPLPIGEGQTISQPYIVAFMTEALGLSGGEKVLEIGTGSGYQAAILAEIGARVYTIEIVPSLAEGATQVLESLGCENVSVRCGDGYRGWPEESPFDAIIVTAAPDHVPQPLIDQLARGGRLIIPVGVVTQELRLLEKDASGRVHERPTIPVRFVPMTGEAEER